MSKNLVILIGNITEPEIKTTDSGKVANFRLAINESYKNKKNERVEHTEWINIVAWGNLAEIIEKYCTKGQQVYLEGKIRTRSYDDKDGNKRYVTEVLANNLQMLGRKSESNEQLPDASKTNIDNPEPEDDIPF